MGSRLALAAYIAAVNPAGPDPMIMTSLWFCSDMISPVFY